jgi:hypothetical protein
MVEEKDNGKFIFQTFKDKKGRRKGLIVAIDHNKFGWAKCNKKDNFETNVGLNIALGRAGKWDYVVRKDIFYYEKKEIIVKHINGLRYPKNKEKEAIHYYNVSNKTNYNLVPKEFEPLFIKMKDRAKRYFKQENKN